MTDQEMRDIVAGLIVSTAELRASMTEIREAQKETGRQINQTNKQLGELGNKFGSFTEGLALPSMEKILKREFDATVVTPYAKSSINGRSLEIDVLAYDKSGRDEVYVVEVKSHLKQEGIDQILKLIADFPKFFPDHAHRTIYGIIAAVTIPDDLRNQALNEGLYLAQISDETFRLQTPRGFKAKAFGPAAKQDGNSRRRAGRKKKTGKEN